jgi:O-antigen/teichoic acid export membrane protein
MALLRHSGIYFAARILAGGASFAIIAAYTRLLDPHAFGELALAIIGVTFFGVLILDGPMLAMQRYLPGQSEAARATALWGLILPAVAAAGVAVVVFLLAALARAAGLMRGSPVRHPAPPVSAHGRPRRAAARQICAAR